MIFYIDTEKHKNLTQSFLVPKKKQNYYKVHSAH